jgi:hypothetical protein
MGLLAPWYNITVSVQRKPANPPRNALNEPNYGNEGAWPFAYATMNTRIEYEVEELQFLHTGERVSENKIEMYVDSTLTLFPEDRIVILTADHPNLLGQLFIVLNVKPAWDALGNVHHYESLLQIH